MNLHKNVWHAVVCVSNVTRMLIAMSAKPTPLCTPQVVQRAVSNNAPSNQRHGVLYLL